MKKQMKKIAIAAVLTSGLFGTTAFAGDDTPKEIENNRLKNRVEYKDMKAAMSAIDQTQERIEFYKAEKKANRKADKTIALHMSKKELRKARVDLFREKSYLRIDRHDLKKDQKVALKEKREDIKEMKKDLRIAKREKRKTKRQGKAASHATIENKVATLENKVELEKLEAQAYEEDVDEFFDYLDDEIDETLEK